MKIGLRYVATLRDGGTQEWKDENGNIYYLNRSFNLKETWGELYDKRPNKKDAKILDKNNFIFL